jgi:hypothetical protein
MFSWKTLAPEPTPGGDLHGALIRGLRDVPSIDLQIHERQQADHADSLLTNHFCQPFDLLGLSAIGTVAQRFIHHL